MSPIILRKTWTLSLILIFTFHPIFLHSIVYCTYVLQIVLSMLRDCLLLYGLLQHSICYSTSVFSKYKSFHHKPFNIPVLSSLTNHLIFFVKCDLESSATHSNFPFLGEQCGHFSCPLMIAASVTRLETVHSLTVPSLGWLLSVLTFHFSSLPLFLLEAGEGWWVYYWFIEVVFRSGCSEWRVCSTCSVLSLFSVLLSSAPRPARGFKPTLWLAVHPAPVRCFCGLLQSGSHWVHIIPSFCFYILVPAHFSSMVDCLYHQLTRVPKTTLDWWTFQRSPSGRRHLHHL